MSRCPTCGLESTKKVYLNVGVKFSRSRVNLVTEENSVKLVIKVRPIQFAEYPGYRDTKMCRTMRWYCDRSTRVCLEEHEHVNSIYNIFIGHDYRIGCCTLARIGV